MFDLIWILPNLNEQTKVVKSNLLKCFNYSKSKGYKSKIVLSDGGSSIRSIVTLKNFIGKLRSVNISVQMMLCFPAMRPNKNLGILNIVEKYGSKYVIILDSDLLSLNKRCFDNLINPLVNRKAKLTLPNIKRVSGRSNKLIINPLLRLFYPEIARKANFVLSGILGMDYNLLRKIVTSSDYCWDWGGEIQIICKGFESSGNLVKIFSHRRQDTKRRKLASKMKEARQIFRTLLYEVTKKQKLDKYILKINLRSDWLNNEHLVKKFSKWQKRNRVNIVPDIKNLNNCFHGFLQQCKMDKKWFFSYLDTIYNETRAYEILVLKSIVVDTILKTLFNINLRYEPKEIDPKKVIGTNLEDISIFADVIFAVYILIWIEENRGKIKSFHHFLDLLSTRDTDFIDASGLNNFRKHGLYSIDITNIETDNLKKIISIYNDKAKSLFKRNRLLMETIGTWKK